MTRSRRDAGFTLIELLISLTLLSMVLIALFGGIRFIGRAEESGSAGMAVSVQWDTVRDVFDRQVSRAFPMTAGEKDNARVLFTGRADRLAFPILRPHFPDGLVLAVFDIEPVDKGGSRLIYREYPFLPGAAVAVADRPTRSTVIADMAFPLVFSYRGTSAEWASDWTTPTALPRLVRLRGNDWPELVARLRADRDAASTPSAPAPSPRRRVRGTDG